MDTSFFTNFYEKNQSSVDQLGINLLNNFIKKKEDKPSPYIAPAPQIVQSSGSKDYTMYFVVGAVALLGITALFVFRK